MENYDEWSDSYQKDMLETFGYTTPASNHIFFMPDGEPEAAVQLWIYEVI